MGLIDRRIAIALVVVGVLLMAWVRFAGLTRGASDFTASETETTAFYAFHPDEETLIRAALDLDLRSPLDPPLTAYGMLPIYLARAVLVGVEPFDAGPAERQRIYLRVRVLAALLSCALPVLVFWLGRRTMGAGPALLAASFVGFAPLAVQQAHFFTVDGFFAFFALVFFCALSRALERPTYLRYALVGLAVGAAAAVRLNGVVLGAVLVVGHCAEGGWRSVPARLRDPKLWSAVLAALGALLVLEPYLLLDPGRLLRADTTDDFAYSLQVARGEALRLWSLVDMHTVPYAHYWTQLWPQGVGWPLTLFFAGGLGLGLWRRRAEPMLFWCLAYFAMVGGLHTKHVRYLLPLLPFTSLFAAELCRALWVRQRWVGGVSAAFLLGYTACYGLAFAGIYLEEDSRVRAGRWVAAEVPVGSRIGVEAGGFSLQQFISHRRHTRAGLNMGTLFGARRYLSCAAAADFLTGQLRAMDYIAVVDINRYRQFVGAPEVSLVASAFYRRLWDESLGFDRVQRFKTYPVFMGWRFKDDDAESSFLGYDHPAVSVFRRWAGASAVWGDWQRTVVQDAQCPDAMLTAIADRYRAGDWREVLEAVRQSHGRYPDHRTPHFVAAVVLHHLDRTDDERQAMGIYLRGYGEASAYLIPWATSASLLAVGLPDLSLAALRHGVSLAGQVDPGQRYKMANSYSLAGDRMQQLGHLAQAVESYRLAIGIAPQAATYVELGVALYAQGRVGESSAAYRSAIELATDDAVARINYGWNLYLEGEMAAAAAQFRRALALGSHSAAAFNLGLALLAQGQVEEAAAAYGRAVEEYGAEEAVRLGAVEELREEVEGEGGLGREILARYWGASSDGGL